LRNAWSCGFTSRPNVLDEFERVENVLVAKVTAAEKTKIAGQFGSGLSLFSAAMTVEKVYKGGLKPGDEIKFSSGTSSCDYPFDEDDVGEEFLLYYSGSPEDASNNGESEGDIYFHGIHSSGRSKRLNAAAEDILYLDNISSVRGKTRISGQFSPMVSPDFIGSKVTIRRGGDLWELPVDSSGVFEIYGLPAGEYEFETKAPDKWKRQSVSSSSIVYRTSHRDDHTPGTTVNLQEGKHVSLAIWFTPDNAIRGTILSPSGKPMKDTCLDMVRVDGKATGSGGCTDKNGEFNISVYREGKYVLVVNRGGDISRAYPYRTFYYPGVEDKEEAEVFSITPGTVLNDINFHIPEFEKTFRISATALYSDGKIVDNVMSFLQFKPEKKAEGATNISENGIHNTSIHKGFAGKLFVSMSVQSGDFSNCPEIEEKLIKRGPEAVHSPTQFLSNEIWISGEEDVADVRLYFPIPYCKRSGHEADGNEDQAVDAGE